MKKIGLLITLFVFLWADLKALSNTSKTHHYYCTASDAQYFPILMRLIGSIHMVDFEALDEIAIFDIGMCEDQKELLKKIQKVSIYDVEPVHPELLTYFPTNHSGKIVPGWYAWKPVIIKQALEMFPYMLYLDAGNLVLKSPDNLFKHIEQNGYFFMHISPLSIVPFTTRPVIENLVAKLPIGQQEVLMHKITPSIDSGILGLSKSLQDNFVDPLYHLASDLTFFEDDGTAPKGFGWGRHDQVLFSIFAHIEQLSLNAQGWSQLCVDGAYIPMHVHWDSNEVCDQTTIYRSRGDYKFQFDRMSYIQWNEKGI